MSSFNWKTNFPEFGLSDALLTIGKETADKGYSDLAIIQYVSEILYRYRVPAEEMGERMQVLNMHETWYLLVTAGCVSNPEFDDDIVQRAPGDTTPFVWS
ncbi:hypothetical protein C8R47DRAFT_1207489 [Mycena vitilis]|nr:hypothetical protein C8R47DRAFT_1207489 [Mycena vitilis]